MAYNRSTQGNNGTWIGTPNSPSGIYYATGRMGTVAGYFSDSGNSGTNHGLTIGTQPVYDFTGPFTISMWSNHKYVSPNACHPREDREQRA